MHRLAPRHPPTQHIHTHTPDVPCVAVPSPSTHLSWQILIMRGSCQRARGLSQPKPLRWVLGLSGHSASRPLASRLTRLASSGMKPRNTSGLECARYSACRQGGGQTIFAAGQEGAGQEETSDTQCGLKKRAIGVRMEARPLLEVGSGSHCPDSRPAAAQGPFKRTCCSMSVLTC